MAVETGGVFYVIFGVAPGGQMTFGARHRGVFSQQRIGGLLVPRCRVERWLPSIFRMTTGAILLCKLPFVRIRSVAVGAYGVSHRFFEVAVLVALVALHLDVCVMKRKLGAIVVERGRHPHLLPAPGRMATAAVSLKCAPVRVLMAIGTRFKGKISVLDVCFAISG